MELLPYDVLVRALREKRRALDVQQNQLAHEVEISPAYLSRIEHANAEATYTTVYRIWRALDERDREANPTAVDLMTTDIAWVGVDDTWRDARELMLENAYSQLPVLTDGACVGSITEQTLVRAEDRDTPIGELMEEPFLEVRPETSRDACATLLQEGNYALLVSDGETLVGIITPIDLI